MELTHYNAVLSGKKPNYLMLKESNLNALKEKVAQAEEMLVHCHFCERRCGINRSEGERGYCGVLESRISSMFEHWGEEPMLIPSLTIFFSGCTFKCVFCQNWDISQYPTSGQHIEPRQLVESIDGHCMRVKNVNWVGGEPTPNLHYILEVLCEASVPLPQIWNSNMYLTVESMMLLNGVIDLYLTDFKYGNNRCAERLSDVKNYWEVVTRNHLLAKKQADVIVRHLVMPNHVECCTVPILEWIAKKLPEAKVNVMAQYRPEYRAREFEDISIPLPNKDFLKAVRFAKALGLDTLP